MEEETRDPICSLDDEKVRAVLARAFAARTRETPSVLRVLGAIAIDRLLRRPDSMAKDVDRLRDLYVPVSRKQGRFLYLVARSLGARRIVEFGTSFGVSTIYLAAAVRDNGGGVVVGSELEPGKVEAAQRHVDEAGLAKFVEIREGDAQRTLRDPGGTVDLAFLDGYEQLYLPILRMLEPHLRRGSVVLGDNIHMFPKMLAPYVEYVQDPAHGFHSTTLALKYGTEYSVRL